MRTTIHVYTVCYNEEVLLPYFLRHYGAFSNKIIVFDDGSSDRSHKIVSAHPKAMLVRPGNSIFGGGSHYDEMGLTRIRNEAYTASRGKANWVIIVDVDEFLYHTDIARLLSEYTRTGITFPKVAGFEMVSESPPSGSGQIYDEIRTGFPAPKYSKRAVFRPDIDINYEVGCHGCAPSGNIVETTEPEIKLLHYRFLGASFFSDKYLSRGKRMSQDSKDKGWGCHVLLPGREAIKVYPSTRRELETSYKNVVQNLRVTDVVKINND